MRRVWDIARKELLQNRRDRLALLFTIVLPVIFTVFLGLLIPNEDDTSRLPLALADADGSPAAAQLVQELSEAPLLELKPMEEAKIDEAVQDQRVAAGLVIPEGYGAALEAGTPATLTFIRVETSTGAQSARQAVETILSRANTTRLAAEVAANAAKQAAAGAGEVPDNTLAGSARSLVEEGLAAPAVTVEVTDGRSPASIIGGGFDQASTGSLVNWVLFSLLGVTANMVWERRKGLLRRITVAGVRAQEIIGGKMLAMVMLTFLQQLFLILLGQFAFGVEYFRSPLALFVTMISLSMMAASFGLLIASLFRSEGAVVTTTVISALLLAALGGAWFPLEVTGAGFAKIAHVLPSAWVMDSLHGITLQGWGVGDILWPMAIVWMWTAGLFALAVWRFRPD
jgi:ABC-2 type transport system permease protein